MGRQENEGLALLKVSELKIAALFAVTVLLPATPAVVPGMVVAAQASEATAAEPADEAEALDVAHHVADGFYLDFTPAPKIELPRIFLIRNAEGDLRLEAFSSTTAAIASGRYDVSFGEHEPDEADEHAAGDPEEAVLTGEADVQEHAAGGHESPLDGTLSRREGRIVLDVSITRHLVFVWIVAVLLLVTFLWLSRRYAKGIGRLSAPRGRLQNALEALITYVRDEIAEPNLGRHTERHLPFLLTLWFFILFANLFGLLPLSVTSTANITITGVLAAFTFVVTQMNGKKDYWTHIFWPPGIPIYVKPILVPIEIMGLFIKPFVLAVRLFANMTAGHMVILSLLGLGFTMRAAYGDTGGYIGAGAGVLFSLFIYLIELLVAFLQAYIFVMLSALYIGTALEEHEHDDEEHEPTHDGHALGVFHEHHEHHEVEPTNGVHAISRPAPATA